jgi:hypothetical protein
MMESLCLIYINAGFHIIYGENKYLFSISDIRGG